jgi:hypothetical protein
VIVSNLLVLEFGRANPEYTSSIPDFLSAGNNVEKLKKWKAVERCMEERREKEQFGFAEISQSWVDLLSHALLDTNVSYSCFFTSTILTD